MKSRALIVRPAKSFMLSSRLARRFRRRFSLLLSARLACFLFLLRFGGLRTFRFERTLAAAQHVQLDALAVLVVLPKLPSVDLRILAVYRFDEDGDPRARRRSIFFIVVNDHSR